MCNKLQSPLLRLPGELRNQIYEHALGGLLIQVNDITKDPRLRSHLTACRLDGSGEVNALFAFSGLTLVSRQLYAETRFMVLRLNEFDVTDKALPVLDIVLNHEKRSEVRTVRLSWPLAMMLQFDHRELSRTGGWIGRQGLSEESSNWICAGVSFKAATLGELDALERIVITGWPDWQERDGEEGEEGEDIFAALRSLAGNQDLKIVVEAVK